MMSVSKKIYAVLFLLSICSIFSIKLSYCIERSTILCPEIEKHSLLSFKQSLKEPPCGFNLLSSWDSEVDCCKWEGVVCNNSTGHVHELHLLGIGGKINASLLNLKHLTYLDLSHNSFYGETIPSFIGSFTNLEYLNLSFGGFEGKIPHNIGNLSNLHTLDLDCNVLEVDSLEWLSGLSKLKYLNMNQANLSRATNGVKAINSLPSLLELHFRFCSLDLMDPPKDVNLSTSLTFLDLSGNLMFSHQSWPIPQWFFQLNNLLSLELTENQFIGPLPTVSNATSLQYIDLSFNNVNSSIPDWLYFCKDLEFVDFSRNYLSGKISDAVGNLTSLKTLDLHINQLSGKLPREITNLCRIQSLELSSNELQGEVQDSFGNMSACFLGSLEYLALGGNLLSGEIPISLGNLSSLEYLQLDDNKLTGNLPGSLGQLSNLERLYIENNKLEGIVTESHFNNLSKLSIFSAAGNHLTLNVGTNWVPPIQLECLGLGSWSLGVGSQIPSWLHTQRNITQLDISNAGISGSIPRWFFYIEFLNVSHNNLHGKIPHDINSSREEWYNQYLFLSSNKLSGSLPRRIGVGLLGLDLSHNLISEGISDLLCHTTHKSYRLEILLLEGNLMSGELPDCWKEWPSLTHLKLGNNTMSGSIPNSIGFLVHLKSLSLYGNNFSGQMPSTMYNCTSLSKMDLSNNNLEGNIPTWMGTSLVNLEVLILRSNKLSGEISSELCHLQYLQILDLSNNQFYGIIPRCVSNFTAMATKRLLNFRYSSVDLFVRNPISSREAYIESASIMTKGAELEYSTILSLVTNIDLSSNNLSGEIPKELTSLVALESLNLSGNHLTGSIPESIGDMKPLESLDLSRNSLSGQIPNGFTLLSYLSHLNLSFNKLTGRIPESTQLQSFNTSSFIGNHLCGPPLSNCSRAGDETPGQKEEKEGEKAEIEWLYVFISLGFTVGFSGACTALVLKKSWRYAYFRLLECMWNNLYVYFHIKWKRFTKPTAATSRR